jgi:hypothetical protein
MFSTNIASLRDDNNFVFLTGQAASRRDASLGRTGECKNDSSHSVGMRPDALGLHPSRDAGDFLRDRVFYRAIQSYGLQNSSIAPLGRVLVSLSSVPRAMHSVVTLVAPAKFPCPFGTRRRSRQQGALRPATRRPTLSRCQLPTVNCDLPTELRTLHFAF